MYVLVFFMYVYLLCMYVHLYKCMCICMNVDICGAMVIAMGNVTQSAGAVEYTDCTSAEG